MWKPAASPSLGSFAPWCVRPPRCKCAPANFTPARPRSNPRAKLNTHRDHSVLCGFVDSVRWCGGLGERHLTAHFRLGHFPSDLEGAQRDRQRANRLASKLQSWLSALLIVYNLNPRYPQLERPCVITPWYAFWLELLAQPQRPASNSRRFATEPKKGSLHGAGYRMSLAAAVAGLTRCPGRPRLGSHPREDGSSIEWLRHRCPGRRQPPAGAQRGAARRDRASRARRDLHRQLHAPGQERHRVHPDHDRQCRAASAGHANRSQLQTGAGDHSIRQHELGPRDRARRQLLPHRRRGVRGQQERLGRHHRPRARGPDDARARSRTTSSSIACSSPAIRPSGRSGRSRPTPPTSRSSTPTSATSRPSGRTRRRLRRGIRRARS